MSNFRRENMSIAEAVALENAQAESLRHQATIDYNIMMGNIEDPSAEEEDEDE